jgi:RNA polymerase sigma-70 factor (ECF subfamily)
LLFTLTFAHAVLISIIVRYSDPEDGQLAARAAQSDPQAIRILYKRYGRLVYGLALHMVGDRLAAEEITQDVFMRVWEKAGSYDPGKSKLSTWLSRIARNMSIDLLRKRGRVGEHEAEVWEDRKMSAGLVDHDPVKSQEMSGKREEVRAAVAALPEQQRKALSMAFFQGLTHSQIAERLGEPLGTVKTRIRDAMLTLKDRLEDGRI